MIIQSEKYLNGTSLVDSERLKRMMLSFLMSGCCLALILPKECKSWKSENESKSLMSEGLEKLSKLSNPFRVPTIDFIITSNDINYLTSFRPLIDLNELTGTIINMEKALVSKWKTRRKKNFIVMIVDSKSSFTRILSTFTDNRYNYHGYYLIVFTQMSTADVELDLMFDLLWRRYIYNVNILTENDKWLGMFTFFPFSADKNCHNTKSQKINEFKFGRWENKTFFPEKLINFHGCKLKAACYSFGPSAQKTINSDASVRINGSDVEILNGLADILNIDMEINVLPSQNNFGEVYENGTTSGVFKSIIEGEIDICGNFYFLSELRSQFMQFTSAYYSLEIVLMIPHGAPFSALQKLLRPFDGPVWIALVIFLFSTFLAVLIIKLHSRKAQFLFFDHNINSPIMEMSAIIFGCSQHMLPSTNFSRILLMSFAIVCLVFRSSYSGSLYKFLQCEGHKKDFQTIDELIENDFEFHINTDIDHMMENMKFYDR